MSRIADYTRQNPIVIVLMTLALCIATVTVLTLAYRHQQHENDRRFCGVVQIFVQPQPYPQAPQTARSVAIQQAMEELAKHLGCAHV
jgi:hypothetical protein